METRQTYLVIGNHELYLLFRYFIKATAYHLGQYKLLIIYAKGFHWKSQIFDVVICRLFFSEARNDLTICRITECSASVAGGKEILLFCEKVTKDDVQVNSPASLLDGLQVTVSTSL